MIMGTKTDQGGASVGIGRPAEEEFLLVRCLSCKHRAAKHWSELGDRGVTPGTSLAKISQVLRCSECGGGAVEVEWGNAATAAFYVDADETRDEATK